MYLPVHSVWQTVKHMVWPRATARPCDRECDESMKRGIELEPVVFSKLLAMGYDVEMCNDRHSMEFECAGGTHVVVGQVDGIIRNAEGGVDTVVEIKNRVHKFFLPTYDVDQLAAYVMMTNARAGLLVQMYNGELRFNRFSRDTLKTRWDKIVNDLSPAIAYMDNIEI